MDNKESNSSSDDNDGPLESSSHTSGATVSNTSECNIAAATNKRKKCSIVWKYFDKKEYVDLESETSVSRTSAGQEIYKKLAGVCRECAAVLQMPSSSTTTLQNHLKRHAGRFREYLEEKKLETKSDAKKTKSSDMTETTQSKITGYLSQSVWSTKSLQTKKMNTLVSNFIVEGLHPYSIVEEPAFVELINNALPRYKVPSRTTFSRTIVPKAYSDERQAVRSEIQADIESGLTSVSFTIDGWKSRNNDNYMSLTVHYLTNNFTYKHFTLENLYFPESHTGDKIYEVAFAEAYEWGFSNIDATIYVITDNASAMVSAFKNSPWVRIGCFAHTLQLVIGDAKEKTGYSKMLKKCHAIVSYYRRSAVATKRLRNRQTQANKKALDLIQDVETRWNSEYFMLQRLLLVKEEISADLCAQGIDSLTTTEWHLAEGMVQILEPFAEATTELSADEYPTLSMKIPVLHCLEEKLKNHISKKDHQSGITFAKNLLAEMKEHNRFPNYRDDKTSQLATTIDPRYKCVLFNEEIVSVMLEEEMDILGNISKKVEKTESINAKKCEPIAAESTTNSLWDVFRKASCNRSNIQATSEKNIFKAEVQSYLLEPLQPLRSNPCNWWRKNKEKFPNLCKVAQKFLSIPATEVSSERLFSSAGNIVSERRECLLPEHVEQLSFLHAACKRKRNAKSLTNR